MVRTHGLRACVIRTLHYTYFSLKKEVDNVSYLRQDQPHSLVKRQCCLMWHKVCNIELYVILLLNHLVKLINHKLLIDILFRKGKSDGISISN